MPLLTVLLVPASLAPPTRTIRHGLRWLALLVGLLLVPSGPPAGPGVGPAGPGWLFAQQPPAALGWPKVLSADANDPNLTQPGPWVPPEELLRDVLRQQSQAAFERRAERLEQLAAAEQIAEYQGRLRQRFLESLGGLPERTPLQPQVVGRLEGDGFRVEKVIYQSRPRFYVTAALYLPLAEQFAAPYPGVLLPCGHTENGKAAGAYQRAAIILARHGIAVLCYDPVGQGERKQILKEGPGHEGAFKSTVEHTLTGVGAIPLGTSLATIRIWDGIRSLDYLASREEIDVTRLGCTGNSGGGLMTSYLMALDDRIQAAAPGCFVTTTARKNESPGPGDAEQNIFGQIEYGLDHADYLILRAPKPTLICSATHDFVPIEGTWEAFREAKRVYGKLGHSERVELIEADERHGFTSPLRIAVARWMVRWLRGHEVELDSPPLVEADVTPFTDRELQCTEAGQVLALPDARSIYDLYVERGAQLEARRASWWAEASSEQKREAVRTLAGIRPLDKLPRAEVVVTRQGSWRGYELESWLFQHADGMRVPALHLKSLLDERAAEPDRTSQRYSILVNGAGMHAAEQLDRALSELEAGRSVLLVDLRGYGETRTRPWRFNAEHVGENAAEFFIAYMLGKSLVGMRAEDLLQTLRHVRLVAPRAELRVIAVGDAAVPALHAAACEPDRVDQLVLLQHLESWQPVIESHVQLGQLENTVHAALTRYDLPDLLELYHDGR